MSNSDPQDLDVIMEEIEASMNPSKPEPQEEEEDTTAIVKRTADDLDDRRQKAWALRQRGKTYREIGTELEVSVGTVKRDLDIARRTQRESIELHDREDYLAGHISIYEDIVKEAWNVYSRGDNDQRIKALNLIRQTTNDQRKALQDTGVVRKENQVQETVQIGIVAKWDDSDISQAAAALLGSQLNLHLAPPTLDVEEAEIVEDEDEDEDA